MIPDSLKRRIVSAETAASIIRPAMHVAMSGYAMAGYPKAVPRVLADRCAAGEELSLNLTTGANVPWIDELFGAPGLLRRRTPMCASRSLASQINSGAVRYVEQQMNRMPRLLRNGSFGKIDIAVVEALGFTEEGELIPTASVGMVHHLMEAAEKIIIEVNTSQKDILFGLHDMHIPLPPPETKPIPLTRVNERIGGGGIPVDFRKICAVVLHDEREYLPARPEGNGRQPIIEHLLNFLEIEFPGGVLPPLQTGFGAIADDIAAGLQLSNFKDLQFFCGGITEPVVELLASGRASALSTGGLGISPRVEEIIGAAPEIRERLVIRNGDITNSGEVIGRLGVLALNTAIEVDIYGNVNSSHIAGNRVVNGIGGAANFAQNSGLSIIILPSTAKSGAISNIVPMVSHQDISEHDIDVVITESGVADLRGLDDQERAEAIITRCASEVYRGQLSGYLSGARRRFGGHHPQNPAEAFSWFTRLKEQG